MLSEVVHLLDPVWHTVHCAGDDAALLQLLKAGANKDEADEEGRTALHFAAGCGMSVCGNLTSDGKQCCWTSVPLQLLQRLETGFRLVWGWGPDPLMSMQCLG